MNSSDIEQKTDEELVKLALVNQDIFLHLVKRYEKKLLSYILRLSNISYQEAEDILQDAFIKIYTNLNDFDKTLKFSSWAYRITHNQVISNYRKNRVRPQPVAFDVGNNTLENLAADLNLDQTIDLNYLKNNVQSILNKLDIKYREVLILKFLEEKSYAEISDIIKKPLGTVATLINRAKKQFRQILNQHNIKLD